MFVLFQMFGWLPRSERLLQTVCIGKYPYDEQQSLEELEHNPAMLVCSRQKTLWKMLCKVCHFAQSSMRHGGCSQRIWQGGSCQTHCIPWFQARIPQVCELITLQIDQNRQAPRRLRARHCSIAKRNLAFLRWSIGVNSCNEGAIKLALQLSCSWYGGWHEQWKLDVCSRACTWSCMDNLHLPRTVGCICLAADTNTPR